MKSIKNGQQIISQSSIKAQKSSIPAQRSPKSSHKFGKFRESRQ